MRVEEGSSGCKKVDTFPESDVCKSRLTKGWWSGHIQAPPRSIECPWLSFKRRPPSWFRASSNFQWTEGKDRWISWATMTPERPPPMMMTSKTFWSMVFIWLCVVASSSFLCCRCKYFRFCDEWEVRSLEVLPLCSFLCKLLHVA